MFKSVLLSISILGIFLANAQERGYSTYRYPSEVPDKYQVDVYQEYDQLRKIKARAKGKKKKAFAENYAFARKSMFESGMIYMNWTEAEEYLNAILQKLIPDEYADKCKGLSVFITNETHYNAYVMVKPDIYVTNGLLAQAHNEAALAAIIGHELTHYLMDDSQNDFFRKIKRRDIKQQKKKHQDVGNVEFYKAAAEGHKNQLQEKKADSLGIVLAHRAGYDVSFAASNFLQMIDIEERAIESSSKLQEMENDEKDELLKRIKVVADHPETAKRMLYLDKYIEENVQPDEDLKEYLVSEEKFKKLQGLLKIEQLNSMLLSNEFRSCIEASFYNYLFDPTDQTNFYYLHESLRRFLYIDEKNGKKPFLTENLKKYFGEKFGILQDISFLVRDSALIEQIKAKELIEEEPFNSYEEAMVYFNKLAEEKGFTESYLILALHYYDLDEDLVDINLAKYLSQEDVMYKDYATALLSLSLTKKNAEKGREIVVIPDIGFYKETKLGMIPNKFKSLDKGPKFVQAMSDLCKDEFKDKEVIDLPVIKQKNFDEYVYLNKVLAMSSELGNEIIEDEVKNNLCTGFYVEEDKNDQHIVFKNLLSSLDSNKKNIFILSPNMWYTFNRYEIKSIERFRVYDLNFKDRTLSTLPIYYWLYPVVRGISGLFGGTWDYYALDYTSFHIDNQVNYYDHMIINANISKVFLQNTMYQMIETNKNLMELRNKDMEELK